MNEVFINIGKGLFELAKCDFIVVFGLMLILYVLYIGILFAVRSFKITKTVILSKFKESADTFCKMSLTVFYICCSNLAHVNNLAIYKNTKVYLIGFIGFLIMSKFLKLNIKKQEKERKTTNEI